MTTYKVMAQDWKYGLRTTVVPGGVAGDATAMSAAGDDIFFSTAPLSNISTKAAPSMDLVERGSTGAGTFAHVSDHQVIVDDGAGGNSLAASTLGALSDAGSNALQMRSSDESANAGGSTASTPASTSAVTVASNSLGSNVGTLGDTNSGAEPVSNAVTVGAGATVELAHAYSGTVSFAGATGTLIIDHASSFGGTISGQLAIGDVIDLADIEFGANLTIAYSGNNSPGTLTVSNGTHTANIALAGNYSLANFTASSDGHGGTSVVDPTTYYVSSSGNDNNAGTSSSAPLATLQAAANKVKPGDTVEVMNGTYASFSITTSGTAGAPITFEAAPGQKPIIDSSGDWNAINIQASYIVIDGFTVVGNAATITQADALANSGPGNAHYDGNGIIVQPSSSVPLPNHITIENNTVYNEPGGGIGTLGADYVQILNNVVHDNAHWSAYGTSGISVAASQNLDTNPGVHILISGNLVYGNAEVVPEYRAGAVTDGNGIILDSNQAYTSQFLVQNNTAYNNGGSGILAFASNNVTITGNTAYNNDTSNIRNPGDEEIFNNQSNNVTITNNITTAPPAGPTVPFISSFSPDGGTVGDGITNASTLVLNGTAAANDTLKIFDGSTLLGTATANSSGSWSYTTAVLSSGSHSFKATDTVNGTTSPVMSVTIDTVTPASPVISSNSVSVSNVTLTGTAEVNSTVTVFDGTTKLGTANANASGAWTYTATALPNGSHSFTATDTDTAGNTSGASAAVNLTLNAPPNLVTNGGFETGSLSGWTLGGNYTSTTYGPEIFTTSGHVQSGQFAGDMGSVGSDGKLSQTLQTTAGQQYTLSFWLANQGGTTNDFAVKWNGATVMALTNAPAQGYTQYTYTVTATGATSVLEFDARQDPSDWYLDSISVTALGPQAPSAPTITSFSPDTGVVGDGITDPAVLTLTGNAVTNSTVNVYDGSTLLGTAPANASGAWSFVTAALPDGLHSFTATDTISGVTSAASPVMNVTIDTVTPAAPTIASFTTDSGTVGDHITNDSTLTLSGTAEANSTVKVFDGATLLGSVVANGGGAWSYTTAALANGAHSLTATASDAAANTSAASAALSVTIDTTAPAAPTIASFTTDSGVAGDHITNDATLTLAGSAEANSTIKVFDGATLLGSATANGSGAWSYTTAALANGAHNLTATATDAAGNTGVASSAMSVTIDTTVPVAPSIASFSPDTGTVGDGITTANVLTLTGTAEANTAVNVYDGASLLGSATANGSGAWSYTTVALANGAHNLTATATDAAGNTGVASSALAVTVSAPPSAPTITSFSPDTGIVGDGITDPAILTLTGTAVANSTVTVYDGTTPLGTAAASASGAWTYTTISLPDGMHHFAATDMVAGVTSAASAVMNVTIDTVAPAAPTIASFSTDSGTVGDHITNDSTLTLTGTGEANSTVKVYDGTTVLGSTLANGSGTWTYTTVALADGAHTLTATASDAAANTSAASAALSVAIDTVAPNAPVIASDATVNTNQVFLTGAAEANSTVNIFDSTTLLGTATADASGAWNFTTSPLSDGAHAFTATDTDAAGNTSVASPAVDPIIGTVAPTVPTVDTVAPTDVITRDVKNSNGSFTLSGTVVDNGVAGTGDTVKIYDGTAYLGSTTVDNNGQWSFTSAVLSSKATHTFTSTATDVAGNVGNSAGAAIYGSSGKNTLVSTAGNDIMTGDGSADTFVFIGTTFGKDVVTDFHTQGSSHDAIQFSKSAFSSFAAVLAHAAQAGSDVVISYDAADSITLKNVSLSQLTKSDFHFV